MTNLPLPGTNNTGAWHGLTTPEKIAVAIVGLQVAGLVAGVPVVVPRFIEMLRDFGGSLPAATQWLIDAWYRLRILAGVPFALPAGVLLLAVFLRFPKTLAARRSFVALAFLSGCLGYVFVGGALYQPILTIEGAIR